MVANEGILPPQFYISENIWHPRFFLWLKVQATYWFSWCGVVSLLMYHSNFILWRKKKYPIKNCICYNKDLQLPLCFPAECYGTQHPAICSSSFWLWYYFDRSLLSQYTLRINIPVHLQDSHSIAAAQWVSVWKCHIWFLHMTHEEHYTKICLYVIISMLNIYHCVSKCGSFLKCKNCVILFWRYYL